MNGLARIVKAKAHIDISLNGGALTEAGANLEAGSTVIYENIFRHGWRLKRPQLMDGAALRAFPTTWARRLAHGRDPRAITFSGRRIS